MALEKYIDSSIVDKAIAFATNAHKNTERRGKGFPYIIHPLEAMAIVSSLSNDPELLAAAVLHDVIEDTTFTYEDIKKEFGQRIADIVNSESNIVVPNMSLEDSWMIRRKAAIKHLSQAPYEVKVVALGDKLSNIRALYRDYLEIGDELWSRFHSKNPRDHKWYYASLIEALSDLQGTSPYCECVYLFHLTFDHIEDDFSFDIKDDIVHIIGPFNKKNGALIEKELTKEKEYELDFNQVTSINYAGARALFRMLHNNVKFHIINVNDQVADMLFTTGLNAFVTAIKKPKHFDMSHASQTGEGYTAVSYFVDDEDSMFKLYNDFVNPRVVEKEKTAGYRATLMGIPTPFTGELIRVDNKTGICFERVIGKRSIARILADEPERMDEMARLFASEVKKFHSTPCDTRYFPNIKEAYIKNTQEAEGLSLEEKEKIINYIKNNFSDATTCIHGDLHIGNAIITPQNDYLFIDIGDFSYGDPLFDLGTLYFMSHNEKEGMIEELFHITPEAFGRFWDLFIRYYLNTNDDNVIAEFEKKVKVFKGLIFIYFYKNIGWKPHFHDLIEHFVLKEI